MSSEDRLAVQNAFANGFTIGVLSGAVGYFLFATDKGIRLRRQLMGEWVEARSKMVAEGVIQDRNMSLREFIYDSINRFFPSPTQTEVVKDVTKKSTRSKPRKDMPVTRFKGV